MTKTRIFAVALSLSAAFACSEQGPIPTSPASPSSLEGANAKPGGPPAGDVAVISTMLDGLDIAGVGGSYSNSTNLKSIIQANNGVWYLDTTSSNPIRTVSLNFGRPIDNTGPDDGTPVHPGSGNYKVFMYTSCNHINYQTSLLTLPAGQTMPCPLTVQFTSADGKRYFLHMNDRNVLFPDTDHVDIECTVPTSGPNPCAEWLIKPTGPGGSNRTNLSYETTVKGKTIYVQQGAYNMSFSIRVAKQ
jgi:hypothetical protein